MDRETYLDRLGVDLEPGGREPAPPPLRVVQRFVNSHNHELEAERDRLGAPEKAARWLVENGLLEPGGVLTPAEAGRLREGREAIRALAGGVAPESAGLCAVVRIGPGGGSRLTLEPMGVGADRALGALFAIVHEAMLDGSWQRMKLCRQCSWLFYDHSRNRSGGWCSMAVCGNRAKNRTYRRRAGP
jgi:predicted RNA-binding Zn ribbon-like protein